MNALIEFYLDNNLGDDLMGEILIKDLQSKGVRCFLLGNNDFTYSTLVEKFPQVKVVQSLSKETIEENKIDLYVKVGGSIFPHNTIKDGFFRYRTLYQFKMMKRKGVKIIILGCNVGPFKSSLGVRATKGIIKLTDLITCRDEKTYNFISTIKKKDYYVFPDIVFTRKDLGYPDKREPNTLGISTYTGYTKTLRKYNLTYSNTMSKVINRYLENKFDAKVKLFVFDTGYNSDFPTTHKIYDKVTDKSRVEIINFNGNITDFMEEFNKCSVMIGTRFHSIILALICKIPILPVIYANKTKNLLTDMKYNGPIINMKNCNHLEVNDLIKLINDGNSLLKEVNEDTLQNAWGHLNKLSTYTSK